MPWTLGVIRRAHEGLTEPVGCRGTVWAADRHVLSARRTSGREIAAITARGIGRPLDVDEGVVPDAYHEVDVLLTEALVRIGNAVIGRTPGVRSRRHVGGDA